MKIIPTNSDKEYLCVPVNGVIDGEGCGHISVAYIEHDPVFTTIVLTTKDEPECNEVVYLTEMNPHETSLLLENTTKF
jgi:hypothetical protein